MLITGAGPIGLMAAVVARHDGARHVDVADINPYRLSMAKRMGVTRAVDKRTEQIGKVMKALDMKEGFDVGMEMSGNKAAFQTMLENMFHGGKIALLGILEENVAINWDLGKKGFMSSVFYFPWCPGKSPYTGTDICCPLKG